MIALVGCDGGPGGSGMDAGTDAGTAPGPDASSGTDAARQLDGGPTDAGASDAGRGDAGSSDAAPGDGGGSIDAGAADAGPGDAGLIDAALDAGLPSCVDEVLVLTGSSRTVTGSNHGAGNDLVPPSGCPQGSSAANGQDVAYAFSAPADGTYTFDTIGGAFDTVLYLLEASCADAVACNDNRVGRQSALSADLAAGETVVVVVEGRREEPFGDSDVGDFALTVTLDAPLEETACAGGVDEDRDGHVDCEDVDCRAAEPCDTQCRSAAASPITALDPSGPEASGDTTGALNNRDVESCRGHGGPDQAFAFQAPEAGWYGFEASVPRGAPNLYLLEEDCAGAELSCTSGPPLGAARIVHFLEAGQVVVVVDSSYTGAWEADITSTFAPAPPAAAGSSWWINEIMYDADVEPNDEWIELVNPTVEPLRLDGCRLEDDAAVHTIAGDVVIQPGEAVVLARSASSSRADGVYDALDFGNGGDVVRLRCGDVLIDEVSYDDAWPWPMTPDAVSIQVDARAFTNDSGGSWCSTPPEVPSYDGTHRGTPGTWNPLCS